MLRRLTGFHMTLLQLLEDHAAEIVDEALVGAQRRDLQHYHESGTELTRQRLQELFDLVMVSLRSNSAAPVHQHAEKIAEERFRTGFGLGEVQTAFNLLEESLWNCVMRDLPPVQLGAALADISTVLGTGKDALARTWVELATRTGSPTLHLENIHKGSTTS